MNLENFLGLWGRPSAIYTLVGDAGVLDVHARWTDTEDVTRQVAYQGVLDGDWHALGEHDLELYAAIEGDALVTRVRGLDGEVRRAFRTLSPDGSLHIRQEFLADGAWTTVTHIYKRTQAKQVLVYRRDLKMRKGKIAAQCAHASMAVFFRNNRGPASELRVPLDGPMAIWTAGRFAKVVLSVESEDDLLEIHRQATARLIPTALITDAGKTEFKGVPTRTAVAIGPAALQEIDPITGPDGLVATKLA